MILTLFVHGTILPPAWCRELPFVHDFYFCPPGITPVKDLASNFHFHKIAAALSKKDPERFPWKSFYLFGWSGNLSMKAREQAAEELFLHLKPLLDSFSVLPEIQIISHSHGGNVVLHFGKILSKEMPSLRIRHFIALACPVQTRTQVFVSLPVFEKITTFHSHIDLLQVMDPQGLHAFWDVHERRDILTLLNSLKNQRTLFSQRHFPATERLLQVHFRFHSLELLHVSFLSPRFFQLLPDILHHLNDIPPRADELDLNWK